MQSPLDLYGIETGDSTFLLTPVKENFDSYDFTFFQKSHLIYSFFYVNTSPLPFLWKKKIEMIPPLFDSISSK